LNFTELHCGSAPQELRGIVDSDDGTNIYLVSARNPIDRLISAFNWDKYEKIIKSETSNPCWKDIYNTFSSINDLVESLVCDVKPREELAKVALTSSSLHMHFGLSWYIPDDVLELLPMNRVALVRTERLLDDFNLFLHDYYPEISVRESMPRDKDSTEFLKFIDIENPKYLSVKSVEYLKKYLLKDYKILNALEMAGKNRLPYESSIS
jgi:hypothetical protein